MRKKKLQTLGSEVKTRIRLYSKSLFFLCVRGLLFHIAEPPPYLCDEKIKYLPKR